MGAAAAKKGKTVANNTEKTINKVKYEGYNYTPIEAQRRALDKIQHERKQSAAEAKHQEALKKQQQQERAENDARQCRYKEQKRKIKEHQAREALCDRAVARAEEVIKAEDVRQKNTRTRSNSVPQARQTTRRDRSNSNVTYYRGQKKQSFLKKMLE